MEFQCYRRPANGCRRFVVALLLLTCVVTTSEAQPTNARYNHATLLKVRAKPASDAEVIAQRAINEQVTLLRQQDKRWCEVASPDNSKQGFVDCSFLGLEPLTLEQLEIDAAAEVLALNRLNPSPTHPFPSTAPAQRSFEKLFLLLERHFAISPSLHTYGDYNRLLQAILSDTVESREPTEKSKQALRTLAESRLNQLALMRAALSRDFAAKSAAPVRHSISYRLDLLLKQRRHGDLVKQGKAPRGSGIDDPSISGNPAPAQRASLFDKDLWAAGWAGGGLVKRLRTRDAGGTVYSIRFDGTGPWALADIYEMAKAKRVATKAQFGNLENAPLDLSYSRKTADRGVETLILDLRIPVWAITASGLIAGTLKEVAFGGDACAGETAVATGARIVFPEPVRGEIHGVFATNAAIDPTRAKVNVRKRTFLEPLQPSFETTFTHRVDITVDLDGDGVPDLRTVVSNDQSVDSGRTSGFLLSRSTSPAFYRRVAGWYANDVYMLQANISGWWRTLSRYNLVTCT